MKIPKKKIQPFMFLRKPVEALCLLIGSRKLGPLVKARLSQQKMARPLCVPTNYAKSSLDIGGCKARSRDSFMMWHSEKPCFQAIHR